MTRVLLFADFGKGPRQVGILRDNSSNRERRQPMDEFGFSAGVAPLRWAPPLARDFYRTQMGRARAWWLVECENAEAGRKAIACNGTTACSGPGQFGCDAERDCPNGRIIASGKGGAQ